MLFCSCGRKGRLRVGLGQRERRYVLYLVEEKRAIPPKKAFVGR